MSKLEPKRERLSIDVYPFEHRQIKAFAAFYGKTIREYVLESVRTRLQKEAEKAENKDLLALTIHLDKDPVLKELWDNEKDTAYDEL
ncbi:MAG: hypothetical protein P9M13_03785 [Candidatus Ancaeobacter aquaticus]|nr:hypothetical protein [Candidatus Ancaeobacter aquaticus]